MSHPRIKSPLLASFADLWFATKEACDTPIPTKEDFSLEALAPFLPRLAMTKCGENDIPYYYFYGTGLIEDYGNDLTGLPITQGMSVQTRDQFVFALNNSKIVEQTGLGIVGRWHIGEAVLGNGDKVRYEALSLPYYGPRREIRRMSCGTTLSRTSAEGEPSGLLPETTVETFNSLQARPNWLYLHDSALSQNF